MRADGQTERQTDSETERETDPGVVSFSLEFTDLVVTFTESLL